MDLSIDINVEHDAWSALPDLDNLVERAVAAALAECEATIAGGTELSVVFCDDAFIRVLNRDWRAKDKPTNVLSFPADLSARDRMLGDIVIAYETTEAEALRDGRSLRDHASHLVVHGLLHLVGFDHETDAEADDMEQRETRALARLGIACPYRDGTSHDCELRDAARS